MSDCYSPHTGEHIETTSPAPWMGRAGIPAPVYTQGIQSAFFVSGEWEVRAFVPSVPVPQKVSNAQGTAALIKLGFMGEVEAYVESITDPIKKALAQVALNKTTDWYRDSPFLNEAANAIGLTEAQKDGLFITANAIQL